ncbi:VOC family protein [Arthrobacter agilis]|uniref:VOC family protein n=1 Tax=Arthrobacter agilis TaxID=37921 RepID=UPI000B34BFAF|nr:VOC family protein [Arthrobacter agilis]OUM42482.1 glyoxalase [Arthrobacter agilis]PPB45831.1 VOC family protein [Arthrobacter agilis]TPV26242.1 VOC family protein [Arthrobacter agilis]VDR30910.1 Glyoxalase-like domain [Arthrobacter agilis]
MTLRWYSTVIESTDHRSLARWWSEALGWEVMFESDDEAVLVPPWARELGSTLSFEQVPPGLVFVPVPHRKEGKNRLHLDFAPHTSQDRDGEIDRLVELGAARIDVGQGPDVTWEVLADPDGNEFCVLSSRNS